VDVNQAVKYALTQRMEIRQQQIAIEEGIFSLIEAKDNNKFKGSISARVGLMGQGDKFNGAFSKPDDNETIGITLTVPIWDWGARKANIRSTELSNENTEISNEEERKSIILDVRQVCRELPKLLSKHLARHFLYKQYTHKHMHGRVLPVPYRLRSPKA